MIDPITLIITALLLTALGWLIKLLYDFDIIENEEISFWLSTVVFISAIVLDVIALIIAII